VLNTETFSVTDLVKVSPPARPVVLKSGGPVMDLEATEGGMAVCSWRNADGSCGRRMFPLACLYSCRPME
jgi:uncharacterized protein YodC (DUF2158 family)